MCNTRGYILIVEDDKFSMGIIKKILDENFPRVKVEWAESAEEGIQLSRDNKYDMLFADQNLGDTMDGVTMIEVMAGKGTLPTYYYIITAYNTDEDEFEGIPVLDKPLSSKKLIAIISLSLRFNKIATTGIRRMTKTLEFINLEVGRIQNDRRRFSLNTSKTPG
jgi:DNA-binding response OmpR family regulator